MTIQSPLDQLSSTPLYRQLAEEIRSSILDGKLRPGEKLPPTRELAGTLGLNRTTVAAAYEVLEREGLIRGHVGRGSFVADASGPISFATSRPMEELFPVDEFRRTAEEVLGDGSLSALLQLGAPHGFAPLRKHLAGSGDPDGILITSGCQQALDLIQRTLAPRGSTVLVEDLVYPGLKRVFERAEVSLRPLSAMRGGELAIVTPNFHNPTGRTMPLAERLDLLAKAKQYRFTLVENDMYSALRYRGEDLPSLADLDDAGSVIQMGSFSKIAFPGLRVGWVRARRDVIARLADAKQWTDLHSDQLSQAILLRFAESGRLAAHRARVVEQGARQLDAVIAALASEMPAGTEFTRPDGGLNLWVRLPQPFDAEAMLAEAERAGVSYLPSRFFEINGHDAGAFRLSFGGLPPARIAQGVALLGQVFRAAPVREREWATVMV